MQKEVINTINNKVISKYFGFNNVKFISTEEKNGNNDFYKENYVFESKYVLLDNSKMGVFAEAISDLYIEINYAFNKNNDKYSQKGKYSVSFRYNHIDGGSNGCSTDIKGDFIVTRYDDNEPINIKYI